MSTRTKTCSRAKTRTHGDAVIERAERRGLTTDRSKISPHAVRRKLRPKTEMEYARDLEHFAEAMALGTIGKLDEEHELPTTDSLRGKKMRRFYNAWERHYNLTISLDVKRSMAPKAYGIEGELAEKLGLKDLHREQAFLTIENYVKLHELLWLNDHHDYVHDGCRVDNANLLNTHCFTSARLKELCQAKYKVRGKQVVPVPTRAHLVTGSCLPSFRWKDGQPDLKLKVRRMECKGKHKKQ
ncbi:hypothetical protein QBC46DRAFT_365220 [Diplogelasinospora grovesii]|uniref:Uncharacterized protein n=1 Tax=Diplogelasinospora grovesii TaxID=303347 RepID=A0AAN6S371_9PEZI|nr:hypothetical protein QBC46DRAFT_365220 [Diplogelasinospora grovesii]